MLLLLMVQRKMIFCTEMTTPIPSMRLEVMIAFMPAMGMISSAAGQVAIRFTAKTAMTRSMAGRVVMICTVAVATMC